MEGSRPLLVEVQALVSPSELVPPRRVANGIDRNRLALVLAVLGRHGGLGVGTRRRLRQRRGGVRVDEPGADLAVALAVAGRRARRRSLGGEGRPLACFGELGPHGRAALRRPRRPARAEAAKFGLTQLVTPETAPTLRDAVRQAFGSARRPETRAA